ncbi:MAG: ankyrin repeat domain-containing protein [Proteobacteria bacterium]|nr:MAG: ankyrin repeat domain-containing protein [Pseudomonadota bacterium]
MIKEGTTALGVVSAAYFDSIPGDRAAYLPYFQKLLAAGANPNVIFPMVGQTQKRGLIHLAAEQGDESLIKFLIAENGTSTPAPQLDCAAPTVARAARTAKARIPLDINFREGESGDGKIALHYAVLNTSNSLPTTQYLLTQGANPNIEEFVGQTGSSVLQLASGNPEVLALLEEYSGGQLRFDNEIRNMIDSRLALTIKPDNRLTPASLETSFAALAANPEFASVVDFNRTITSCVTGEALNLLAYTARYIIAEPLKAPLQWTARNKTLTSWLASPRSAKICDGAVVARDASNELVSTTPKDLFRESLIMQNLSAAPALKTANKTLWCTTLAAAAKAEGCWTAEDEIASTLACNP